MANFPTWQENVAWPTEEVTITPPAFAPTSGDTFDPEGDWAAQQWRDAAKNNLGKEHPLSLNRDASQVTNDPYTP